MQTKNCESLVLPIVTRLSAVTKMLLLNVTLAIALHPRPVKAFESWEHQQMADMAFRAAIILNGCRITLDQPVDCFEATRPSVRNPAVAKIFTSLLENSSQERKKTKDFTYGDIDRCVDFFLTPEKLMVEAAPMGGDGPFTDPEVGSESSPVYSAALPAMPSQKRLEKLGPTCQEKGYLPSQWAAAHVNHTHFQSELIMSASVYQMLALTMARDRHALYAALFTSAIQSHYTQDFFAPGHIVSPRAAQTDLVANATHDEYNEKGAYFRIRDGRPGEKNRTIGILKDLLAQGTSKHKPPKSCHNNPDGDASTSCDDMEDTENRLRQKIWEPLLQASPDGDRGWIECAASSPEIANRWTKVSMNWGALPQARYRPRSVIEQAVKDLDKAGTSINVKGDKLLWRNNKCDLAGLPQRLVMLAVNTLAIMDVIDAYVEGCRRSGDPCRELERKESTEDSPVANALPETGFGDAVWAYNIPDTVTAGLPFGYYAFGQAPKGETDNPPHNVMHGPLENSTIFAISAGRESFTAGSRAGRNIALIEALPLTRLPRLGEFGRVNLSLALGVVGMQEGRVTGTGAQARLGLILPQTETTLSIWGRRTYHDGTAEHGWRNGYGLRLDQGFSSFLSVYGGIGVDYGATSGGPLLRSPMVMVGVMIGTPLSRIKRMFDAQNGPNRQ